MTVWLMVWSRKGFKQRSCILTSDLCSPALTPEAYGPFGIHALKNLVCTCN